MKLTKREGIYVLNYRSAAGKRVRRSLGTRNLAEAERKAQAFLSGKIGDTERWTLAKALHHCYAKVWQFQKSWKKRMNIIDLINSEIGHEFIDSINYASLTDYVTGMRKRDLKPATINRRLATISKALNEAAKLGHIAAVPPIPRQAEDNKRTRWLSEGEERALLASCDVLEPREAYLMQNLLIFLIDTGARFNEAAKIYPEHVDRASVLFLETKSTVEKPKHRRVPLTKRAYHAAKVITKANEMDTMFTYDQAEWRLRQVVKKAELNGITFHIFRHTCASRLIQRGASLHEVREWLGHCNVLVTERYAHLADSSLGHLTSLLEGGNNCGYSSSGHSATTVTPFRDKKAK